MEMIVSALTAVPAEAPAPRRGRPPRALADAPARQQLIRAGLAFLTERGYSSVGVDEVLRQAGVPKGSFYHYFPSKAAFGLSLVEAYRAYFASKLDRHFLDEAREPLSRLRDFIEDAERSMARHGFRRGCLVGNLGQEMSALPEEFRAALIATLEDWQARTARCLHLARDRGQLGPHHDPDALAAFFWTGWEGAVLRAKLEQRPEPLRTFAASFFRLVGT